MRVETMTGDRWRSGLRRAGALVLAGALVAGGALSAAAQSGGYGEPVQIGEDGGYEFAYSPYVSVSDDTAYQYATGADGQAYYTTYDGTDWAAWAGYADQPGDVTYDPVAVDYDGASHAFYTGKGGELYHVYADAYGDYTWEDVAGDYTFAAAPTATYAYDAIQLYGYADDGYIYHASWADGAGWSDWEPVNDADSPAKAGTAPYAVTWGDRDNVFWTGASGKVWWNRYAEDGTWSGPVAVNGDDYTFADATYAVGYSADESLYAYSATSDGVPAYNTFDGDGWSGWTTADTEWTAAAYQPSAYEYDGAVHVAYTGDDGHGYYASYADGTWSEWYDLGANYGWDTYQYEYDGGLYLTYTGEDGGAYYRAYAADGGPVDEPSADPSY